TGKKDRHQPRLEVKQPCEDNRDGQHNVRNSHEGNHRSLTLLYLRPSRTLSTTRGDCSTNALPGREIEWRARFSRANRHRPRTSCDLHKSCVRSKSTQLQSLASFLLGAFFQCRFARELYAALVVNADAFDPNHVANLDYVFG